MLKKLSIFVFVLAAVLACSKEVSPVMDESLEIMGINPFIKGGGPETRAVSYKTVGRKAFVAGDTVNITKLQRTVNVYEAYQYTNGLPYMFDGSLWLRTTTDPERIYWADGANDHTIVAFSTPNNATFRNKFKYKKATKTYYSALGDPTAVSDTVDLSTGEEALKTEDLLTSYSTSVKPNVNADLAFKHTLAEVKVTVNISEFSSYVTVTDENVIVKNLVLKNLPVLYKWDQTGFQTKSLESSDQAVVDSLWSGLSYDLKKNVKLWIPSPGGEGTGVNKTFTYYGLVVPTSLSQLDLDFGIEYQNPLFASERVTKNFASTVRANTGDVVLKAGYCTNINISLSHVEGETVVGVDFTDWQYAEDQSGSYLRKNSPYLTTTSRDAVTIYTDPGTTYETATWLYEKEPGKVVDTEGHSGDTRDDPYTIASALHLLSFAYEVKNGNDFAGKYIMLDAELVLQPSTSASSLSWLGIGESDKPFNGYFYCKATTISRHRGAALFENVGLSGKVDGLRIKTIGASGTGVLATTNDGLIFGCCAEGDISCSGATMGGLVGTNNGAVVACYHRGTITNDSSNNAGGLVGTNNGSLAACYHVGEISAMQTDGAAAVATAMPQYCYYDKSLLTPTSGQATSTGKSSAEMKTNSFVNTLNGEIESWVSSSTLPGAIKPYVSAHKFSFIVAEYPELKTGEVTLPQPSGSLGTMNVTNSTW